MNSFSPATIETLGAAYPEKTEKLSHSLGEHHLLTLPSLVELASSLPTDSVEYNPGALPIGIAPEDIPAPLLSISETIRSIEENGSWMVLKRIEQHPAYAQLLAEILSEIEPLVREKTGAMLGTEGFVFISSPGAVTPFHFDPEHNILMQIRGQKVMTVFPANNDTIVSAEAHELFHLGKHHRNLTWDDGFAPFGDPISLGTGEAIYVPVKSPHWVQNGPEVSISLSVTWRSEWSYQEADARAFNHRLRRMGITPSATKRWPQSNLPKSVAFRALRKVGIA